MAATRALIPLDLSRGDPAEATPGPIAQAGIRAIEAGQTHYTDPRGVEALRVAIAQALHEDVGVTYDPQCEVLVTAGAAPALFTALMALTAPGDGVLIPDPGWPPYREMLAALHRRAIPYPIPWALPGSSPEAWGARLSALITPQTRVLLLNFPHNPTGTLLDGPWLEILAALCARHPHLVLVSDEVYAQIVFGGHIFRSPAALPELAPRTVVVRSFSKAYRMPGWRVGYLAAPAPLAEPAARLHLAMNAFASTPAQAAALWALRNAAPLVEDFRCRCRDNRDYLLSALAPLPDFRCTAPQGTFYLFPGIASGGPDCASGGLDSRQFAERLASSRQVLVYPGALYGSCGEGHIRLCFAVERAVLEELIDRLRDDEGSKIFLNKS